MLGSIKMAYIKSSPYLALALVSSLAQADHTIEDGVTSISAAHSPPPVQSQASASQGGSTHELARRLIDSGLLDEYHLTSGEIEFHKMMKKLKPEERVEYCTWMSCAGVMAKCKNIWQILNSIGSLRTVDPKVRNEISDWMHASGAWDRFEDGETICWAIKVLSQYNSVDRPEICSWLEKTGLITILSGTQIASLLDELMIEGGGRRDVCAWLIDSGLIAKYQTDNTEDIQDEFTAFLRVMSIKPEMLKSISAWMKRSDVWGKCQNIAESSWFLRTPIELQSYESPFFRIFDLMKEYEAWDMCRNGIDIRELHKAFAGIDEEALKVIIAWLKDSGVWGTCQHGEHLAFCINKLKGIDPSARQALRESLKKSGGWDRCRNGAELAFLMEALSGHNRNFLSSCNIQLFKNVLVDHGYMDQVIREYAQRGDEAAKAILEPIGTLPAYHSYTGFYLLYHVHYKPLPAFVELLEKELKDEQARDTHGNMNYVLNLLGREHPFIQQCLKVRYGGSK